MMLIIAVIGAGLITRLLPKTENTEITEIPVSEYMKGR